MKMLNFKDSSRSKKEKVQVWQAQWVRIYMINTMKNLLMFNLYLPSSNWVNLLQEKNQDI